MVKKQDLKYDDLVKVKPITDNQKVVFEQYKKGQNLFLHGAAGTGKTFVSLYLALQEVLDTWFSLCLNNQLTKHLVCCMID